MGGAEVVGPRNESRYRPIRMRWVGLERRAAHADVEPAVGGERHAEDGTVVPLDAERKVVRHQGPGRDRPRQTAVAAHCERAASVARLTDSHGDDGGVVRVDSDLRLDVEAQRLGIHRHLPRRLDDEADAVGAFLRPRSAGYREQAHDGGGYDDDIPSEHSVLLGIVVLPAAEPSARVGAFKASYCTAACPTWTTAGGGRPRLSNCP